MEGTRDFQKEKRKNIRFPGEKLPQSIKTLTVSFGNNSERYDVRTIDASVSGISFRVELPVYSIRDYDLTIRANDSSFTLHDELVYARAIDEGTSRVSVHFSQQPELPQYAKLIDDAGR